jgi:hypothetical protein
MKYFKLLIYYAISENLSILNLYDINSSSDSFIILNSVEVSKNMIGISMEKEILISFNNNIEINFNKEDFKNYLIINLIKKNKDLDIYNNNKNQEILSENFMKENFYFFQKDEQNVFNYYFFLIMF